MPYKDPEQHRQHHREWMKTRSPRYMKWLYERRKFRYWKAEFFAKTLLQISEGNFTGSAQEVAKGSLLAADQRDREVGRFFDHEIGEPTNEPHYGGPE